MGRDDTRSVWSGTRILLVVPAIACLELPGWWRLTAVLPATLAVTGLPRRRGMQDWDVPGQDGTYPLEVVGVQFFTDHLLRVLESTEPQAGAGVAVIPAALVPEPDNVVDAHAVAVHIDGRAVGHLTCAAAALAQPAVVELNRSGLRPCVNALVSVRRDLSGRWEARVRLDLPGYAALRVPTREA